MTLHDYKINIKPAARMTELPVQFFAKLVAKANARIALGKDVINLGQGNPDQPTPPHIVKALQNAAENPLYHKYPPFSGYQFLKEAVVKRYKEDYGVQLDASTEVAILFGGKTGLVEISQCFLDPGDICLVPDPGYPDYWSGVALAGAKMEFMPLIAQNNFLPDFSQIKKEIAQQAKLMFLNYPNNPTGATATKQFYDDVISFAKEHNIIVTSDFAYGTIGFDGKKPVSFLQQQGAKDVGIEVYTLSKSYNMAGWRVGFALGNKDIIAQLNLIQDHYYCSLFGGIQEAAAIALTESQQCVAELTAMYERRRDALFQSLKAINWQAKMPSGSFFCWLPVPKGMTSEQFSDLVLEQADVVLAPGNGFGSYGEGYVRLGLLTSEQRLQEAISRIGKLNLFN